MSKVEERPWGSYGVLLSEPSYKVKKISINPGQRFSKQLHLNRDEYWVITNGVGRLTHNKRVINVFRGDMVHIEKEEIHRLENVRLDSKLEFIEVQLGICEEGDIIRLEDDYDRK